MTEENNFTEEENITEEQEIRNVMSALIKHWKIGIVFIILISIAVVGLFLTLFWVIEINTLGGNGTWTIGDFSLADIIGFFLILLGWELLIVVLPTIAVLGSLFGLWWRSLPQDEKDELRNLDDKDKKKTHYGKGTGGFNFILFIAIIIIVYIDGNLFTAIGTIPYVYWFQVCVEALFWLFIFVGLPALILGLIYLKKKYT
ncbi:MAG: hypothetical protein GF317_12635 [Candidatus Lokiarchaeota archaeon]|nr:hypothetical protein [Candidatus Lokiarchaeota archaeon]MBD3200494.1 hypothetical protein [Candidatus Lokiarchaeota archaeon]